MYNALTEVPNHIATQYFDGKYSLPLPEVRTTHWTTLEWINWIDENGDWLGDRPISDAARAEVEAFCDRIATEVLMPNHR